MMPMRRPLLLLLLLFAGCASGPTIRSEVDPKADFTVYRTFAFFQPFGLEQGGYGTPLSNLVRSAAQDQLTRRGLRLVDTDPDLWINAGGNVVDKQQVDTVAAPGAYYHYRSDRYTHWQGHSEILVTNYQEGTLTIDAIDRKRNQLTWSGTAVGRVTEKTRAQRDSVVPAVVGDIFATFPVPLPAAGR